MPSLCLYHEVLKSLYTHMHMYIHTYTSRIQWRPVPILWSLLLSLWVHMFYSFILQDFVLLESTVSFVSPSSFVPVSQGSPISEGRDLMEISSWELCVRGSLCAKSTDSGQCWLRTLSAIWMLIPLPFCSSRLGLEVITLPSLIFHQYLSEFSTHMSNVSSCLSTNALAHCFEHYIYKS